MASLEAEIGRLLREKGLTLGAVESATGGLISHTITNVAGSSDYYLGSVTSYSNDIKVRRGRREGRDHRAARRRQRRGGAADGGGRTASAGRGRLRGGHGDRRAGRGHAGQAGRPVLHWAWPTAKGRTAGGTFSPARASRGSRPPPRRHWSGSGSTLLTGLVEQPVVTCFLESGGRVLLLRRSGRVGTYQGKWAAVSGYLEDEPEKQAFTEIEEETGLRGRHLLLVRKGNVLTVDDTGYRRPVAGAPVPLSH